MKINNKDKNIVLIGFMGSGKTSVGKRLSLVLKREFIDTDDFIEKREGMTINEIFKEKGEEEFLKEDGKYYVVIRAVHGKQQYDKECFYRFGEELILAKHPVLLQSMPVFLVSSFSFLLIIYNM